MGPWAGDGDTSGLPPPRTPLPVTSLPATVSVTLPVAAPSTLPVAAPPNLLVGGTGRGRSPRRGGGRIAVLGPAFVAAVAYVDPGNYATNLSAGATFGYSLAWVILGANLMAMLVQYLSAKVGVVTGRDLPELCRELSPRWLSRLLWVQAELVAMATDLAEFVGAALGLHLLFGIAPLPAGLLTAVVAFGVLALQEKGHRPFEVAISALLALVVIGLTYDLITAGGDAGAAARGLLPGPLSTSAIPLAAGIIGATVMPHVVYLHSALTKRHGAVSDECTRRGILRLQRIDVLLALSVAGLINLFMLFVAASLFHGVTIGDGDWISTAHAELGRSVSGTAALAFAVALLASGLSSSSVGTYAGQVVMQGFISRQVPLFVRRAVTMAPALLVLASGLPLTDTLVVSQIVLSFGIPFALIPLLVITSRRGVMGAFTNHWAVSALAAGSAVVVIVLNGYVLLGVVARGS